MSTQQDDMLASMGDLGKRLGSIFRDIGIAEKIIDEMKEKHPMFIDVIDASFPFLQQRSLSHLAPMVYEHHCREIIQRVVDNEDPREMTKAECMLIISETSLMAPLSQNYAYLYTMLFKELPIDLTDGDFVKSLEWARPTHPKAHEEVWGVLSREFKKHPLNTRKDIPWKKRKI